MQKVKSQEKKDNKIIVHLLTHNVEKKHLGLRKLISLMELQFVKLYQFSYILV